MFGGKDSSFRPGSDMRLRAREQGRLPSLSRLGVTWLSSFRDSREDKRVLQVQIVPLKEEATPRPGRPWVPGKGGAAGVLDPAALVTSVSRLFPGGPRVPPSLQRQSTRHCGQARHLLGEGRLDAMESRLAVLARPVKDRKL